MAAGHPALERALTRHAGSGAKPPSAGRWRALLALVALVATLAAVPGAWARSTYGALTSADEPHYLLTAIALGERRTLDVDPELRAERWRAFHAADLPRQAVVAGQRQVAPHDPLLPALLAGPVWLFGWRAGRLALAAVNGLLALTLTWTAVKRLRVRPRVAAATVLVACVSAPLLVYGAQVYPELPAALAVSAALAAGLGPPGRRTSAGVIAAVVALPWLSVKYVPVAAVLALLHLVRLHRAGRPRLAWICVALYAVAGGTYAAAHLAWYGGLTAYASGEFFAQHGGQLSVLGTQPNLAGRARRLLGLLVDRGFGLAAWQPAWLLLIPAAAAVGVTRPRWRWWLLAPLAAGWLTATFAAVTMHGWWFPGRHVVHALPAGVLAVAWWLDSRGRAWHVGAGAVAALGVWATADVLAAAVAGRRALIVDFASTANPWYRAWSRLLPDYFTVTRATWALHALWLGLAVATLVGVVRSAGRRRRRVGGS